MSTWLITIIAAGSFQLGMLLMVLVARLRGIRDEETPLARAELEKEAARLATVLTGSPNLRAKLFANPTRIIGRQLPPRRYWDYGIDPYFLVRHPWKFFALRHLYRARLAKQTLVEIADRISDAKLSAAVNTDAVFEDFFGPIVRVSQRTFDGVLVLSVLAFAVGCGLIGAGVYIALYPPAAGSSTVLGSIFGASGAIGALGSVYAMTISGISGEARRSARLRLLLTGFATQLGQLRGYAEGKDAVAAKSLEKVREINEAISEAMKEALLLIPELATGDAEPPPAAGAPVAPAADSCRSSTTETESQHPSASTDHAPGT